MTANDWQRVDKNKIFKKVLEIVKHFHNQYGDTENTRIDTCLTIAEIHISKLHEYIKNNGYAVTFGDTVKESNLIHFYIPALLIHYIKKKIANIISKYIDIVITISIYFLFYLYYFIIDRL